MKPGQRNLISPISINCTLAKLHTCLHEHKQNLYDFFTPFWSRGSVKMVWIGVKCCYLSFSGEKTFNIALLRKLC